MKNPYRFTSAASAFLHNNRILLAAALATLIVSIIAMAPRESATARSASPAAQSGFTITSPAEGSLVPCGQPITVPWTGGNPSDNVNLVLIDAQAFHVFQGFGVERNTGSRVVTIGPGSCGRSSQFHLEDSPRTTWTYGPVFTVVDSPPTPTPTPTPATCGTATSDAASDFSTTSNPNGSWSYGWETTIGGAFTLDAVEDSTTYQGIDLWEGPDNCGAEPNGAIALRPFVGFNHTGATLNYASGVFQPANILVLHPSCSGKFSVVRWTAPTTGSFSIVGLLQGIDTRGTTTDVHVLQNSGTALFSGNVNGFGNQSPFSFTRNLTAGETLDFAVGFGSNGNYNADSTGLAVTITNEVNSSCGCFSGLVPLRNGTATFSSTVFEQTSPDQAVDGNFNSSNGWHIERVDAFGGTTSETAIWETASDVSAGPLVFKMHFLHDNPGHLLGRFRFSVTTDDRSTFADGLDTGGDVDANWIVLTNPMVSGPAGMTFTTLPDNSVLAGGTTAPQGVYTISYSTTVPGITGIRLEALEDPSLPGGMGQACFQEWQFFLTELQLYATAAMRTVTVTIPSTAGPWSPSLNPAFGYGIGDNTAAVVIDASSGIAFTPGSTLTVSRVSGLVQAGGGYPFNDANGLLEYVTNSCTSNCFPGFYMNSGPNVYSMELVGTFANNGVIVGRPFPIGNGPTALTVPAGANQLLLGINDNRYGDNSGSFTVVVNVPDNTSPIVSCPSPTTAAADSNCQARVPNVLAGVTASGGCGGPVTLSQSPAAGTLVGLGTTTITVTATDAAQNSSTCTTTFTVFDNTPPNITAPADISIVDNAAGSCGASVNPGTPVTSDNCGIASVAGIRSDGKVLTALYPVGATVITWTATDNSGNTRSTQQKVIVTNPAPKVTITGPSSGALYVVNTAVNFTGSFTDNAGDSHTAVWTFDGTPQAGTINETTHAVSASHTFNAAGVYLVTLTVTDDCGQTGATNQVGGFDALVVIYDQNAGFVTGGGWINSPAGAYVPILSLAGKANFGFVSRYQKGANVPDGQTEFQFKVANLNFHSTVYEWLVVAGARAQYKGSGTINGMGNYGFLLTAIDGDINGGGGIDKFRIKIWDKSNGDAVVYDNQMGAGIDDNPTTALAGGSIVIHK